MINNKVCAIVVTYNPNCSFLIDLLNLLVLQVEHVVVIDNGSCDSLSVVGAYFQINDVNLIRLGANKGIGCAHNIGIKYAQGNNFDFVLLMDQDSLPEENMVSKLLLSLEVTCGCAVGPRYYDDRRSLQPPFTSIRGFRLKRHYCCGAEPLVSVDHLISSGCLFPIWAFDLIGYMREDLFIDNIDVEWGLRAKSLGYSLFGVYDATMMHRLGDDPISALGRQFVVHTPSRHYYQFRNTIILLRESWVPLNWKIVYGWRFFLKFIFYLVFSRDRMLNAKMMAVGVLDGLKGRWGCYKGD